MHELDGATIFWLITLGMLTGSILKLFLGEKRGLGMMTNIIGGVLGSLVVGIIAIKIQMPGSMLLGLMGTMAILFLANVFFMAEDEHPHEAEKDMI